MEKDLTITSPQDGMPIADIRNWRESRLLDHSAWFAKATSCIDPDQTELEIPKFCLDETGGENISHAIMTDSISILNGRSRLGDDRCDLESVWETACFMWRLECIPDDNERDIFGETEISQKLELKHPLCGESYGHHRCWHHWPSSKDDDESPKLLQVALFINSVELREIVGRVIGRCKQANQIYRQFFTDCTEDDDIDLTTRPRETETVFGFIRTSLCEMNDKKLVEWILERGKKLVEGARCHLGKDWDEQISDAGTTNSSLLAESSAWDLLHSVETVLMGSVSATPPCCHAACPSAEAPGQQLSARKTSIKSDASLGSTKRRETIGKGYPPADPARVKRAFSTAAGRLGMFTEERKNKGLEDFFDSVDRQIRAHHNALADQWSQNRKSKIEKRRRMIWDMQDIRRQRQQQEAKERTR